MQDQKGCKKNDIRAEKKTSHDVNIYGESNRLARQRSKYYGIVVVVFTLNRCFYPTTSSAHPDPVLIVIHPREILILWSHTTAVKQSKPNSRDSSR